MFKTFFQRWWLLNRLHKLSKRQDGKKWVKESHLTMWIAGTDVENDIVTDKNGNFLVRKNSSLRKALIFWLYDCKDYEALFGEIRNVVFECERKDWIRSNDVDHSKYVNLGTIGKEMYSVSYLIFGHEYARKVWTGLIVGGLVLFLGHTLEKTLPHEPLKLDPVIIEINHAQQL